jgi:signal transduction histidine kinase
MSPPSVLPGSSLAVRTALAMSFLVAAALFLADRWFQNVGAKALDEDVAAFCYQRSGWLGEQLRIRLLGDGSLGPEAREFLADAARQFDVSLVLFHEADTAVATAHGPSLARSLRALREHPDAGFAVDNGDTPWVPRFSDALDRDRFPDRNGRPVRVQGAYPFAVETPVGDRLSLRVIPLSLSPNTARSGMGLFGLGLLLCLASFVVAGRVVAPVERLAAAMGRMARGDLASRVRGAELVEVSEIVRSVNSLADRARRARDEEQLLLAKVAEAVAEPLRRLKKSVEGMDLDTLPESQRAAFDALHATTRHLSGLAVDMGLWAAMERGELRLDTQAADVSTLLEEAVAAARRATGAHDAEVNVVVGDSVEAAVDLDPRRFRMALAHILDNALRHGAPPVSVTLSRAPGKLEFSVRDRGPGLDADELGTVFQPFCHGARSGGRAGLGLGLRIAQQIVELHRGGLMARNHGEGGLELKFWLPAPQLRAAPALAQAAAPAAPNAPVAAPRDEFDLVPAAPAAAPAPLAPAPAAALQSHAAQPAAVTPGPTPASTEDYEPF